MTLFIRPILGSTEKAKWLRLFSTFLWFVEDSDKDLVDVAAGSTMLLPYIILSIPVLALANYDVPELKPVGIVLIFLWLTSEYVSPYSEIMFDILSGILYNNVNKINTATG
ncbi:hypothetical protein HO950_09240 [Streptococcus suis]|nr:hypothetical protein [Streptococcus suis]